MGEACVYVVDDDPTIRQSMDFLLRSSGLRARGFAGGEELLDAIDGLEPGCIVLDMGFPRQSGIDIQRELVRRGSRMPVIAMTGAADRQLAERSRALGAVCVLEKPFEEEDLLSALRFCFGRLEGGGLVDQAAGGGAAE